MGKALVLAEKPSVGRDIGRVLGCHKGKGSFLENNKYVVTWALGHLVTLADPEAYDERYKMWRIDDLPMLPEKMKLVVIKKTSRQFNVVKEQIKRKDIGEIIIATDAGREGELVARWILEKVNVKKPIKRLWISSVTDRAIKEGFSKLEDGRNYENLYASAASRAAADWYVGINATRALTCKYNAQLSCGRVQTPTLAIINKREEEIKAFQPKKYYGITAQINGVKFTWQGSKNNDTRIFSSDVCSSILNKIKNKDAEIVEVNKTYKKTYSPRLYDLTELQRDGNKLFGFSAKETLSIMQRLYENHKLLTYPRTDSRYIPTDVVGTLKERIRACGIGEYSRAAMNILRSPIKPNKNFVDNSKITDHHAIIPTEQPLSSATLNNEERKIYDLVVKRFFSVLYPPFEYESTVIKAKIGDESFTAKGKTVIKEGFKEIYGKMDYNESNDEASDQTLPSFNKGDKLNVSSLNKTIGETKPPAHFNEASLLSAMENPVKYMNTNDKTLLKSIGEAGGLGTVATRADIIEKLFNTFLIEKRGKDIYITSKGKQLLNLVPEKLKSPELTAEWEQELNLIAKGKLNKNLFINDMKDYAKDAVKSIKEEDAIFHYDNITKVKCPVCGKYMLEVNGKRGKMLVCQDRECGYRKSISHVSNARCPNCHKKMEIHGEGDGKIFVCSCGYREKLSAFNERRSKEKSSLSKRDVSMYLRKQKKEAEQPINSALADALKKLKF